MKETTVKEKTMIEKGMLFEVKKDGELISGVVLDLYKHKSWLHLTILSSEGEILKCYYSLWDGSIKWQEETVNVLAAMTFIKQAKEDKK